MSAVGPQLTCFWQQIAESRIETTRTATRPISTLPLAASLRIGRGSQRQRRDARLTHPAPGGRHVCRLRVATITSIEVFQMAPTWRSIARSTEDRNLAQDETYYTDILTAVDSPADRESHTAPRNYRPVVWYIAFAFKDDRGSQPPTRHHGSDRGHRAADLRVGREPQPRHPRPVRPSDLHVIDHGRGRGSQRRLRVTTVGIYRTASQPVQRPRIATATNGSTTAYTPAWPPASGRPRIAANTNGGSATAISQIGGGRWDRQVGRGSQPREPSRLSHHRARGGRGSQLDRCKSHCHRRRTDGRCARWPRIGIAQLAADSALAQDRNLYCPYSGNVFASGSQPPSRLRIVTARKFAGMPPQ
jgi:hypothetical protein